MTQDDLSYARLFGRWIASRNLSGHELMELMDAVTEGRQQGAERPVVVLPLPEYDPKTDEYTEDDGILTVEHDGSIATIGFTTSAAIASAGHVPPEASRIGIERRSDHVRIYAFTEEGIAVGQLEMGPGDSFRWRT